MTDFMTMKYNVDMVFCIDATGSMSPVLETVKQNALNFYDDVTKVMNEKQKSIICSTGSYDCSTLCCAHVYHQSAWSRIRHHSGTLF